MSDRSFKLVMLYAGHREQNIRCELFLRQLRIPTFRVTMMELLRDTLWFLIALAFLIAFWVAIGYGIYELVT